MVAGEYIENSALLFIDKASNSPIEIMLYFLQNDEIIFSHPKCFVIATEKNYYRQFFSARTTSLLPGGPGNFSTVKPAAIIALRTSPLLQYVTSIPFSASK